MKNGAINRFVAAAAALLLFCGFPTDNAANYVGAFSAAAESVSTSGKCGDSTRWTVDDDTLTISGSGAVDG